MTLSQIALTDPTPSVSFLGILSNLNTGSAFTLPTGIAVDAVGDIFVADRSTQTISKIVARRSQIKRQVSTSKINFKGSGQECPLYTVE